MIIQILTGLSQIVLSLLLMYLIFVYLYFTIVTFNHRAKNKQTFKEAIIDHDYIQHIDFIKWIVIDILRGRDHFKLFGLWLFCGYYGQGKTLSMIYTAFKIKNAHPNLPIKIFSNINIEGQDGRVSTLEEIANLPPYSIFIFDESQNDLGSRNVKAYDFNNNLKRRLTQMRKTNLLLFMSSPVYNDANINIRESSNYVVECKNFLGLDRLFFNKVYRREDYQRIYEDDSLKKNKYLLFKNSFVASDKVYNRYDTREVVGSIAEENAPKITKSDANKIKVYDLINDLRDELRNEFYKTIESEVKSLRQSK